MPDQAFTGLLALPDVRQCMWEAWQESLPDDPADRHEEGGYFVRNEDGTIGCVRWPRGDDEGIDAPPLVAGYYQGHLVLGEFHTHPHPLPTEQEPSEIDLDAIVLRRYPAESYVISASVIYFIEPNGLTIDLWIGANDLAES